MLKKTLQHGLALLFLFILSTASTAQNNLYYAYSLGMNYAALPSSGYTDAYYEEITLYSSEAETPAKGAMAEYANNDDVIRASAVMLDDRTEVTVYERRYYKRLAVEEPVYDLTAPVTPPVSSVNKVLTAPHGYLTYQREFTENYVMPDFRADVWLEKPYLIGSRMQIIKDNSISHTYTPDDSDDE